MMITLESSRPNTNLISKQCGNEACSKSYKTLLKCSRCRLQSYCGAECQKADWAYHRKICKLEKVVEASKDNKLSLKKESLKESIPDSSTIEKTMLIPGLRLIEDFIPDDLHKRFITQMKKGSPEINNGHYDGYVFEDNEAFDEVFYELTKEVFSKLKQLNFFLTEKKPLKLACTLVGYKKDGFITQHIDSPLLSGGTVIVISFNSPVVVNFYSQRKVEQEQHKIFVPPKSMYAISEEARYDWSHAILKDENTYNSVKFKRGTRYAVLFTPPGPLYSGSELLDY